MQKQLLVGVDVGYRNHHVAISAPSGIVDQFEISHDNKGFEYFFNQISTQARRLKLTDVVVGMEGTNGYARPLDQMVKDKGYTLLNVNNLKLARFKEIFASPAKTDRIDAGQIVTFMRMAPFMGQANETLQKVHNVGEVETKLKRFSRRRRQLVDEKVILLNRMQADLQSVCPGFIDMFKEIDALYGKERTGSGLNYLLTNDTNDRVILVINMARKPRIHYLGALYHVMVRGNNRENVLGEEIHKNRKTGI